MEYRKKNENGEEWFLVLKEKLKKSVPVTIVILHPITEEELKPFENVFILLNGTSEKSFNLSIYGNEKKMDISLIKELAETGLMKYEEVFSEFQDTLCLTIHPASLLRVYQKDD